MSRRRQEGFSIVEVLVAVVILSIGMLVLAGGSLFVTRDLVRSRQGSVAAAMAQARLDDLKVRAMSTTPMCLSPLFTSSTAPATTNGVTIQWTVPTSGSSRTIRVITSYQLGRGRVRTDTLAGQVAC